MRRTSGAKVTMRMTVSTQNRQPGFDRLTTGELASFRDLLRKVAGAD